MAQVTVYSANIANVSWPTDKCRVATSTSPVTYQVYATALGTSAAVGNIYGNSVVVGPNQTRDVYVGVGNIFSANCSATFSLTAIGAASSAQAGVIGS